MSLRFEFAGVADCPIAVVEAATMDEDEFNEIEGLEPDGYAIILGDANATALVIEADEPRQLVEFCRTALRMAEDVEARANPMAAIVNGIEAESADVARRQGWDVIDND